MSLRLKEANVNEKIYGCVPVLREDVSTNEELVAGRRAGVLWRTRDEEDKRDHAGAEDGEVLDDVEIGQHRSLTMKLVVDVGLGRV